MKIKVEMTLEVNVEGWIMDYGIDKKEVREDVKSWVETFMQEANHNIELKAVK